MTDEVDGLERQMERGSLRTQSLLNRSFDRIRELEGTIEGLVDLLVSRGSRSAATVPQISCASDGRIWKNFDAMELNAEWLGAHFKPDEPLFVHLDPPGSTRPGV